MPGTGEIKHSVEISGGQRSGAGPAGTPGAAVFASSVVARIGVANHEAIAAAKDKHNGFLKELGLKLLP